MFEINHCLLFTGQPRLRSPTESWYVRTVPDGNCPCPYPPRRKMPMSRLSWVQNFSCVQSALKNPHFLSNMHSSVFGIFGFIQKILVRSRVSLLRLSCVQSCPCPDYRAFKFAYVQTIVRSNLPMSRLSCVQICLCPDYRAFKFACVQTIVRSNLPISRLSCVPICLCPEYRAFKFAYVQTIVRSNLPMSRLSCVQICLCPDYRAFKDIYVQTIVRSKIHMSRLSCVQRYICPDYCAIIHVSRPCNFERTTPPSCVHFSLDISTFGLGP